MHLPKTKEMHNKHVDHRTDASCACSARVPANQRPALLLHCMHHSQRLGDGRFQFPHLHVSRGRPCNSRKRFIRSFVTKHFTEIEMGAVRDNYCMYWPNVCRMAWHMATWWLYHASLFTPIRIFLMVYTFQTHMSINTHCFSMSVFWVQGVFRTASEPYDALDLQNITSHLTNHCIQVVLCHGDDGGSSCGCCGDGGWCWQQLVW